MEPLPWAILCSAPGGSRRSRGAIRSFVGLPGRRPDLNNGVTALGQFHPKLGIPTSLGDVGVHPGVSGLDMGGLGVPFTQDQSQSVIGGTGVPGGTLVLHGGNVGCLPDPDKGVPSPARSYHASGPRPLASPRSLCGSPVPSSVAVSISNPSRRGTSLPSLVSFLGCSGDHSGAGSSGDGYQGLIFFVFWPMGWHSWSFVFINLLHSFCIASSGF